MVGLRDEAGRWYPAARDVGRTACQFNGPGPHNRPAQWTHGSRQAGPARRPSRPPPRRRRATACSSPAAAARSAPRCSRRCSPRARFAPVRVLVTQDFHATVQGLETLDAAGAGARPARRARAAGRGRVRPRAPRQRPRGGLLAAAAAGSAARWRAGCWPPACATCWWCCRTPAPRCRRRSRPGLATSTNRPSPRSASSTWCSCARRSAPADSAAPRPAAPGRPGARAAAPDGAAARPAGARARRWRSWSPRSPRQLPGQPARHARDGARVGVAGGAGRRRGRAGARLAGTAPPLPQAIAAAHARL